MKYRISYIEKIKSNSVLNFFAEQTESYLIYFGMKQESLKH